MSRRTLCNYLELCRVSNLPTVWFNVVAAFLVSGATFSTTRCGLLLVSVSLLYCGGVALNDLCDCTADAVAKPLRPIPSGRISCPRAGLLVAVLFGAALALLAALDDALAFHAGTFLLLLVILYDLLHPFWSLAVLFMAGCRFMVYVVAGLAAAATVSPQLLALASVQFCYVLLLTLIARREKRTAPFAAPVIPIMLSGIVVLDGVMLALLLQPRFLAAGIAGGMATFAAQLRLRGD